MKYQPLHDLIDPEVPAEGSVFDNPVNDDPDAPNDAFVIGAHGRTVQAPDKAGRMDRHSGTKPWVPVLAFVVSVACVGLTVWNVNRLLAGPPAPPKPTQFQIKQALYLGVMRIDAYRRVHGVTPRSLSDAGLPDVGPYSYQRVDPTHYVISYRSDAATLDYDSDTTKEQFFGAPEQILTMGGSQ